MAPSPDGELFDLVHRYFGIGDYAADYDKTPWHVVRTKEIAKIKAMRRKRSISVADFVDLAEYCHRHRKPIKTSFGLLEHWPDMVRERARNARSQMDEEIQVAIEIERNRPDGSQWLDRLLRAQGTGRQVLLNQWRLERQELDA